MSSLPIHRCTHAEAFRRALEADLEVSVAAWIGGHVHPDRLVALVAGGSIPLGLATAQSDIDLVAITTAGDGEPGPAAAGQVQFNGSTSRLSDGPAFTERVIDIAGREVDLTVVRLDRLLRTLDQLAKDSVLLNFAEIRLLSRIKTGWWLHSADARRVDLEQLRLNRYLDVRVTVWNYLGAVQDLQDARAAVGDAPLVAAHLGRAAVERAIFAYFARLGYAFLGSKWLRVLTMTGDTPQRQSLRSALLALRRFTPELMFPTAGEGDDVVRYLSRVEALMTEVRSAVEGDLLIRVALARTRQLDGTGSSS